MGSTSVATPDSLPSRAQGWPDLGQVTGVQLDRERRIPRSELWCSLDPAFIVGGNSGIEGIGGRHFFLAKTGWCFGRSVRSEFFLSA